MASVFQETGNFEVAQSLENFFSPPNEAKKADLRCDITIYSNNNGMLCVLLPLFMVVDKKRF
jgi:hypothetical protein